jgi:ABC-2 type transport system permease protein
MKFLTIAATSFRLFTRDRTALVWTFAFPIMLVVFLNLMYAEPQPEISVLVVQQDNSPIADAYVSALDNALNVVKADDAAAAEAKVRDGAYVAAIIVPAEFGERVQAGDAVVRLVYDETKKNVAAIAIRVADSVLRGLVGPEPPATLETQPVHGVVFEPPQHIVPAVAIISLMITGAMWGATSIHEERERGTLRRHLLAPIDRASLLAGQLLSVFLAGCMVLVILFAIGIFVFDMVIAGSLLLVAPIGALVILLAAGLGLAIAPRVRSAKAAEGAVMTIAWPMFFLSGLFVPIEFMPQYMQTLAWIFPTTYAMDAFRGVIVHGEGLLAIAPSLAVVAGFVVVFFMMGLLLLKWEE